MKLFQRKKRKNKLQITLADRDWVEDNFNWLVSIYGYPVKRQCHIEFNEFHFPATSKHKRIEIPALITDFCELLNLRPDKIDFVIVEDIRDGTKTPYHFDGNSSDTETEFLSNGYKIHLAKTLFKHPNRLINSLIHEFINIRLTESKLDYDTGEDANLFVYLAAVYFGFGVLLSQNLRNVGSEMQGEWVTTWSYVSEMPPPVMAYALATFSKLFVEDNHTWATEIPNEIKQQFEASLEYLKESPNKLFDKTEIRIDNLFAQSELEYKRHQFKSASSTIAQVLPLTEEIRFTSSVYNNLGYHQLRLGEYEKGISNFHKAIKLEPGNAYAHDNLGYALIMTGELEEGKTYLEKALKLDNNDHAYSYRNLGLYHFKRGEYEKAEESFQLAFGSITDTVDLLDFHYAKFLIESDKPTLGMKHLEIAVKIGDPEAIALMNKLKGTL